MELDAGRGGNAPNHAQASFAPDDDRTGDRPFSASITTDDNTTGVEDFLSVLGGHRIEGFGGHIIEFNDGPIEVGDFKALFGESKPEVIVSPPSVEKPSRATV